MVVGVYTHIHTKQLLKKGGMYWKESKRKYMGMFGGRKRKVGNNVIML